MWELFTLALRNVRRNRSRTALTLGAIAFGVFMTLFLGGFAQGFVNMLVDDTVLGKTGAVQVHRKGYFDLRDSQPLDYDFDEGGELARRLGAVPGVRAITARLVFSGLVNDGNSSTLVTVTALDPATVYDVLPMMKEEFEGRPLDAAAPRGAIVGLELSKAFDAPPGSSLVLQASSKAGRQNALDLDVVGLINNGNAFESKRVAYVTLPFAQELLGMPGRVTEYVIAVDDREAIPRVAAAVAAAAGPEFEVQTWRELRASIADLVRFVRIVLSVICFVFLVIAVIGIVNTLLMSVLERTREIGTMMAIGLRRGRILVLFLFEATVLAVVGGGAGVLAGTGLIGAWAARGGVVANAPGTTVVKHIVPATPAALVLIALGAVIVGSLVAAVYPAWRASRLRPVDALRAT